MLAQLGKATRWMKRSLSHTSHPWYPPVCKRIRNLFPLPPLFLPGSQPPGFLRAPRGGLG